MNIPFFNKSASKDKAKEQKAEEKFQKKMSLTGDDIGRLSQNAGSVAAMFKEVKKDPDERIMLAAGIAGFACHQAVKYNKENFVVTGMDDGSKFFFGDAVNFYLIENPYSVMNFLFGYYKSKNISEQLPDIHRMAEKGVKNISDSSFKLSNRFDPSDVYKMVQECWEGIYKNMTVRFCRTADEWPVLYAIVLQKVLMDIDKTADVLFNMAAECAMYLSKMDDSSIRKKTVMEERGEELVYSFYSNGVKIKLDNHDEQFIHSSIDIIRGFFKENKIAFSVENCNDEFSKIFEFKMLIKNEPVTVWIKLDLKPRLCTIAFFLPFSFDMKRMDQLCVEICKMNFGRKIGSIQLDPDNGSVIARASFPCAVGLDRENFLMTFMSNMNTLRDQMDELKKFSNK